MWKFKINTQQIYKQENLMHLYFERVKKAGERHAIGVFFKSSLCESMKQNLKKFPGPEQMLLDPLLILLW